MSTVNITINGIHLEVEKGVTIMDAARQAGFDIPHLCYHEDLGSRAHCRLCLVEQLPSGKLTTSCHTPVSEGLEVRTDTQKVLAAQRAMLELILSDHKQDCLTCPRNGSCELQTLQDRFGVTDPVLPNIPSDEPARKDNPSIVRDPAKCIKCGRCVRACANLQGVNALTFSGRSAGFRVATAFDLPMGETDCVLCGQCSLVCPVGAIVERDDTQKVWDALHDPTKHVIVQTAPAVRVALGDAFGLPAGALVTGRMVAALRRLGFDKVFDANFAADLTIMEEASELLERLKTGGKLPLITSCSPGWVNFVEKHRPDLMENLSTAKSPQGMFGAVSKTYYSARAGISPHDIVTVSVMPCTAKKFEAQRPELGREGYRDVDVVLTTRELAKMIRQAGLDLTLLSESGFDSPLGTATGAGAIFGVTGGVMEAALRTAYELYTGKTLPRLDFTEVRGFEGVREATVDLDGTPLKVAVAHTLKNAAALLERAEEFAFIEIMACPGGCIGGGGQPIGTTNAKRRERIRAIYELDRGLPLRKSHENPEIQTLYRDFFDAPLSLRAHALLHTSYTEQPTVSKL